MGYIIEPAGVDFTVAPSILTAEDTAAISGAIADYKKQKANLPSVQKTTAAASLLACGHEDIPATSHTYHKSTGLR